MSRSDLSDSPSSPGRPAGDHLAASAQRALTDWRAAFDQKLDALERALRHPGQAGDLSALIVEFAHVAGEEAEAAARHASFEARLGAQQAAEQAALEAAQQTARAAQQAEAARADRVALDEARRLLVETQAQLAEAGRTETELRQALEGTRRAQDETRRALDEARHAAVDAEAHARQGDEERRELLGVQAQLTRQLEQARAEAKDAEAHAKGLGDQLAEATREADTQARDLQTFRRRLEQAVRDAEERSRVQEGERARVEQASKAAADRVAVLAGERDRARDDAARVVRELDTLRPQLLNALARITSLEGEVQERDRDRAVAQVTTAAEAVRREAAPALPIVSVAPPQPAATAVAPALVKDRPKALPPAPPAPALNPAPLAPVAAERSPATQWLQTLQSPPPTGDRPTEPGAKVGSPATAADGARGAERGEAGELEDEAASFDPPASPDSTGVFSTVADALRAWANEPTPTGATGAAADVPPTSSASVSTTAAPERPKPGVSPYEALRRSVRHELVGRRIDVTIDQEIGQLVDLSAEGAQVVTAAMLKPGRHVRVAFPIAGPLATAKAKIVWSRLEPPSMGGGELQYRAGVTFTKIEPRTIERVLNAPETPTRDTKRSSK